MVTRIEDEASGYISGLPLEIQGILKQCSSIFEEPKALPPNFPMDYRIQLMLDAKPVHIRLYHYPYFQKLEIKQMIKDLLEKGFIGPSTNSFHLRLI